MQASDAVSAADRSRQREIVDAFFAASRNGEFGALLALLDPDVVLHSDAAAAQAGAWGDLVGAAAVAEKFSGQARAALVALIDGVAGAVWAPGGQPRIAFEFTVVDGKIVAIDILGDPGLLGELDFTIIDDRRA